jgi:uncharacterized protein (DUF2236 family)
MTVTPEDLERHLARITARVEDPRAGIYGPGSVSWEVNRESIILLGGGCAALLQLAHPFVAHAVDQHSHTKTDPVGRFARTFNHVFAMVFGDLDHALTAARRVHALHTTIRGRIRENVGAYARGDRYHANDEHALLWVHATLVASALDVFERVVRRLSAPERERYYEESKLFAYLFGIPDSVLPATWADFARYYEDTIASDTIAVGAPALELRRFLFQPPTMAHTPVARWYEVFTAGLLPPKLREQLGFAYGPLERAVFERSIPLLRAAHHVLPRRLRYFPAYVEAERRLAGKREHDPVGRWLEQVALRSLQPSKSFWAREARRAGG